MCLYAKFRRMSMYVIAFIQSGTRFIDIYVHHLDKILHTERVNDNVAGRVNVVYSAGDQ
jgi:hypothetical protein